MPQPGPNDPQLAFFTQQSVQERSECLLVDSPYWLARELKIVLRARNSRQRAIEAQWLQILSARKRWQEKKRG